MKVKTGGTNTFAEELMCTISMYLNTLAGHPEETTYKATSDKTEMEQDLANLIADPM